MRFTFRLLAAVAVVSGMVGSAKASPIIIDSFLNPAVQTVAVLPAANLNVGAPTGNLPGTRGISFSPALPNNLGNDAAVGGGSFSVFTGSDAVTTTLLYTFAGGPLDFSGLTQLSFDFAFSDGGTVTDLPFTVEFLTNSGVADAVGAALDDNNPQTVTFIPFDFSNFAFLNQVTGLRITFNQKIPAQPGADVTLSRIRADGDGGVFDQGDPVPEPASLAVFGVLALSGGLAVARRKFLARRAATA